MASLTDNSIGVIYDCNMFIEEATGLVFKTIPKIQIRVSVPYPKGDQHLLR